MHWKLARGGEKNEENKESARMTATNATIALSEIVPLLFVTETRARDGEIAEKQAWLEEARQKLKDLSAIEKQARQLQGKAEGIIFRIRHLDEEIKKLKEKTSREHKPEAKEKAEEKKKRMEAAQRNLEDSLTDEDGEFMQFLSSQHRGAAIWHEVPEVLRQIADYQKDCGEPNAQKARDEAQKQLDDAKQERADWLNAPNRQQTARERKYAVRPVAANPKEVQR